MEHWVTCGLANKQKFPSHQPVKVVNSDPAFHAQGSGLALLWWMLQLVFGIRMNVPHASSHFLHLRKKWLAHSKLFGWVGSLEVHPPKFKQFQTRLQSSSPVPILALSAIKYLICLVVWPQEVTCMTLWCVQLHGLRKHKHLTLLCWGGREILMNGLDDCRSNSGVFIVCGHTRS